MRIRLLALVPALILAACSADTSSTTVTDGLVIVPDYANSSATLIDAAGVGGSQFPTELNLTTEQKAAIEALHAAFETANAADVAALRAIEAEARAARQAGKSMDDIRVILARGAPILARMDAAFAALQAAIFAIYTPAQQAWITAHQPKPCGPGGPPTLTDAQKTQIKSLQDAFQAANAADIAFIRQIADSAHRAAESGATRDAVNAILLRADAARGRVHAAEVALQAALDAVLTPDQRAARCQPQRPLQPPPHG